MIDWFAIAASALDQSMTIMGEEFETSDGRVLKGIINEADTSEVLAIGGFESHASIVLYVAKTDYPEPVKGDYVTIKGVRRRIVKTADHPVSWSLFLEDISR